MGETSSRPGPRKGVWMFPSTPAGQLVDAIVRAETLGLDEVWIADEGVAREPMALLAAAARETTTIRLAVGVTSPLLRHPGVIASTAATIDELSGGRFALGLGIGGEKSLGPFGLSTERPVGVLREAIITARAVLASEPGEGYEPPGHAMGRRPVPIWVGTRGPQMVRVAADLADGIFLSGGTPELHESIIRTVSEVDASTQLALYQSASNSMESSSVSRWGDVGSFLRDEMQRWSPESVGINLVDLNDGSGDPVALVERAAAILLGL